MYSPQGLHGSADAASRDRSALLRFVLEQKDVWSRLSLPEGTTCCDDLDLDVVSVPELLSQLRLPGARPNFRDYGRGARGGGDGGGGGGVTSNMTSSSATPTPSPSPAPRSDADITAPSSAARKLVRSPPVREEEGEEEEEEEVKEPQLRVSTKPRGGAYQSSDSVPAIVSLDSFLKTPSPALKSNDASSRRSPALIQPIPGSVPNTPSTKNNVTNIFSEAAPPEADYTGAGIAAPIPELILPELRGGGRALRSSDAVAQCAYELFAACAVWSQKGGRF